jgi:predicted RNase H-like HicB family nuclease
MSISYQPEEISFDENISFNKKIYNLHIERCEEGGFYGEIKGIDGCYTQGKTLEELRKNIIEVLELYSEEELNSL